MRSKLSCLVVVFCAAAVMFIAGCAKSSNPVSSTTTSGYSFYMATAAGGPPINSAYVNETVIFIPKGQAAPVVSIYWKYGEPGASDSAGLENGLTPGSHKYRTPGTKTVIMQVVTSTAINLDTATILIITLPSQQRQDSLMLPMTGTLNANDTFVVPIWVRVSNVAGINPFLRGLANWNAGVVDSLYKAGKNASGSHYVQNFYLAGGRTYNAELGHNWLGSDQASVCLTDSEQYLSPRYDPLIHIQSFFLGFNGHVYRYDSIPSDSGRTYIPPDTTQPGLYGDVGTSWVTRWYYDSTAKALVMFENFTPITGCIGAQKVFNTNIPGMGTINVSSSATKDSVIIPVADIPAEGLIWSYQRGLCPRDMSSSLYYSAEKAADWAKFITGLGKVANGGSVVGRLVPVR